MGKTVLVKLGGIVVTVIVLVIVGIVFNKGQEKVEEAKAPKVGECLNMTGSSFNADHEEIDCGDELATYEVVSDEGSCDAEEINYTISLGSGKDGNVADLCLTLNGDEGDCFDLPTAGTSTSTKIACEDATSANWKVASVGKPGDACAKGSTPWENVTRGTQLCMAPAA